MRVIMNISKQSGIKLCLSILLVLGLINQTHAQPKTITVEKNQSIRDISRIYLGDAELWQTILEVNRLSSAASIRVGMELIVPGKVVILTNKKIKQLNDLIKEATKLQAKIFANRELSKAILFQKQVLVLKKSNRWEDASKLLDKAIKSAEQAIKICKSKQNQKAEAVLNDLKGKVDRNNLKTRTWFGAELFSTFIEGDKIRTLGDSFAEILFKDESKLRLNSNSQVVIKQSRSNLLKKTENTTVSVIKGGVFALLNKNSRNSFEVKVPGMTLKTNSKNFFIDRDENGKTKVANYDGKMTITHKRKSIDLAKDQGLFISKDGLSKPKKLLPPPKLITPKDNIIIYKAQATFKWEKVKGAVLYWLEIANDSGFNKTMINANRLTTNSYTLKDIKEGTYFWRISSLDKDGFPSKRSRSISFQKIYDDFPPYIAVNSPESKTIVDTEITVIKGDVEPGVELTLQGKKIDVTAGGKFEANVKLTEGPNKIKLKAVDLAGNSTDLIHLIHYKPIQNIFSRLLSLTSGRGDGGRRLLSMDQNFTLSGETLPKSKLKLYAGNSLLGKAISDKNGKYQINFILLNNKTEYQLKIVNKKQAQTTAFFVELDNDAPLIEVDSFPQLTRSNVVILTGLIKGASRVVLDETPIEIINEKFVITLELNKGKNNFLLSSFDRAGNSADRIISISHDRTAPILKNWTMVRQDVKNKKAVLLKVNVIESSGLVNYVPFEITSGRFLHSGHLRKGKNNQFSGLIYLPNKVEHVNLVSLTLEDKVNNKRQLNINKRVFVGK